LVVVKLRFFVIAGIILFIEALLFRMPVVFIAIPWLLELLGGISRLVLMGVALIYGIVFSMIAYGIDRRRKRKEAQRIAEVAKRNSYPHKDEDMYKSEAAYENGWRS